MRNAWRDEYKVTRDAFIELDTKKVEDFLTNASDLLT